MPPKTCVCFFVFRVMCARAHPSHVCLGGREEGARGGGGPLSASPDRLVALGRGPGHTRVGLHAPRALGVGGAALTAVFPATFEQGYHGGHKGGPKVSHLDVKSNAASGVV